MPPTDPARDAALADLRAAVRAAGLTEATALNRLNNAGLISDHCVTLEDIATEDLGRARRHLKTDHAH